VLFLGLCLRGRIEGLKRRMECDFDFDDDYDDTTCFFHCIASDLAFLGCVSWVGKGYDRQRTARFMARWLHVHFQ
jgi:hypothetical protein